MIDGVRDESRALAFALPTHLMQQGYSLRAETADDDAFLLALFVSTREAEMEQVLHWTAEQKQTFLAQQFAAQRHHYRTQIAGCSFEVIERHGKPVGRLYLEVRETQIHIVDIALVPESRAQGLGRALIEAFIGTAARSDRGVGIFVEKNNPALGLYRRLGFTEIRDTDFYWEMERVPESGDLMLS